jgi:hypothetical protein
LGLKPERAGASAGLAGSGFSGFFFRKSNIVRVSRTMRRC